MINLHPILLNVQKLGEVREKLTFDNCLSEKGVPSQEDINSALAEARRIEIAERAKLGIASRAEIFDSARQNNPDLQLELDRLDSRMYELVRYYSLRAEDSIVWLAYTSISPKSIDVLNSCQLALASYLQTHHTILLPSLVMGQLKLSNLPNTPVAKDDMWKSANTSPGFLKPVLISPPTSTRPPVQGLGPPILDKDKPR